jgi:nitrous oxide reductase accessory protein NosL
MKLQLLATFALGLTLAACDGQKKDQQSTTPAATTEHKADDKAGHEHKAGHDHHKAGHDHHKAGHDHKAPEAPKTPEAPKAPEAPKTAEQKPTEQKPAESKA